MKIKHLITIVFISGLSLKASAAQYFHDAYIGIEALQTNQNFYARYASNKIFANNPQNYAAMVGFKFSSIFGVEAGYEMQPNVSKKYYFLPGQTEPGGNVIFSNETYSVTSYYRASHPYFGFSAQYVSEISIGSGKLKMEAFLGASISKVTASSEFHEVSSLLNNKVYRKDYSKKYVAPMFRLSAFADLTKWLSLGLSVQYRNMSGFTLTSAAVNNEERYTIQMKDMLGVGLIMRVYF